MRKHSVLTIIAIVFCTVMLAIPADPRLIDYQQEDGSTIQIYNRGDERLHWAESLDGYTLLNKNGNKVYAIKDQDGDLVPSDVIAHEIEDRRANEVEFLSNIPKGLLYSEMQSNLASQVRNTRMGGFPTTGTNDMLLILANFNDTYTTYSQSNFNNLMNQSNYSGHGSFKDYYFEASYGQLTVNTTVVGWVEVANNHDYYGPQSRWAEFVRDACQAADSQVDFSQFDNDGDGDVDGIAVIHQGRGQESTSDESDIWSHNFSLVSGGITLNLDGVQIKDYTCQPEKAYWSMAGIGVICHEFGHNLGTADFYDTDYQTGGNQDGTGEWDIMGSGAYNGGGDVPAHHNMYSKIFFGWVEPIELEYDGQFTLENSIENPVAYYFTTATENEYFLLDNVQDIGFASETPGHGLLIYHVDGDWVDDNFYSNSINTTSHQGLYIVASNGSLNTGNAPYPSPGHTDFTDTSYPAITPWEDHEVGKGLTNITESNNVITFDFFNNSAYVPYVEFENIYNNQHFNQGDELNLNFELFSTFVVPDFIEVKLDGRPVATFFTEPYEFTYTIPDSFYGYCPLEANIYSGNDTYTTSLDILIDTWEYAFVEEFESVQHESNVIGDWTNLDLDNQPTLDIEGFDYAGEGSAQAFVGLDIEEIFPPVLGLEAWSGSKVVAAFPIVTNTNHPAANDMLISPDFEIYPSADGYLTVSFWYKGTSADGEMFNVLYASNPEDESDYEAINNNTIYSSDEWNLYEGEIYLEAGNDFITNVAIQNVSTGGNYILIDAIYINDSIYVPNANDDATLVELSEVSNYPNPFNPETTIEFNIGKKSNVKVEVFNIKGQKVNTLVNDNLQAGKHKVVWNGDNTNGEKVSSGIYFYKVTNEKDSIINKMIMMK